jgi:AraC-like DNA-binding protein
VGVTPKLFCRIRRFQDVLTRLRRDTAVDWADIACACGYFDQAHFVHDFRTFSGLTPTRYESHNGVEHMNFVPVEEAR